MRDMPFSLGTIILGGGALLISGVLLLGFLLPSDFSAARSIHVDAPPEVVFTHLDSPEGWRAWTPWPDTGLVRSGPEHGAGAAMSWDDRELGSGSFEIIEASLPRLVRYEVLVQGGAIRTNGSLEVTAEEGGSRIDWVEEGDLGRNPLMGYWAISMSRAQGQELQKGLEKLAALLAEPDTAEAPADSVSAGG